MHYVAVWRRAPHPTNLADIAWLLLELLQLLIAAMSVFASLAIKPLPSDIVENTLHRMCDFVPLDSELVLTDAARGRAVVHGCLRGRRQRRENILASLNGNESV